MPQQPVSRQDEPHHAQPLGRSGAGARIEPVSNVLVAYAARDGTVAADGNGRNSPFTGALLEHIETPGLEINFLFRNVRDEVIAATRGTQQPFVLWIAFEGGDLSRNSPVATSALPGPDEVAWGFLKETTDKAALQRFTVQYGPTARCARRRRRASRHSAPRRPPSRRRPRPTRPQKADVATLG